MSVHLASASSQYLYYDPATPNYNAAYTYMAAVRFTTLTGDPTVVSIDRGAANFDHLYLGSASGVFRIRETNASVNLDAVGTTTVVADTWYYVAMRRNSATSFEVFVGTSPAGIASESTQTGGNVASRLSPWNVHVGSVAGGNFLNGDITAVKLFTSALSLAEIKTQAASLVATQPAWADWPLILPTDRNDRSGNGRTPIAGGGTHTVAHQPSALPNYLWLPSSGAAPISPAFDASWEDTEDADRILGSRLKGTTALTNKTSDEAVTTNPVDVLARQYVFGPFTRAGTWDGAMLGVIRCAEDSASANAQPQMLARIVSSDGTVVRGTLVAHQTGTSNEFALTTLTSRYFPLGATNGLAVTGVAFQVGDYLVIEFGARDVEAASTNWTHTYSFGENGAADLDFSEVDTGADNPFFMPSFPLALVLTEAAVSGTATAAMNEADVVAGGKTIIITLSGGAQWIPA